MAAPPLSLPLSGTHSVGSSSIISETNAQVAQELKNIYSYSEGAFDSHKADVSEGMGGSR